MPLYTITTLAGVLGGQSKADLAARPKALPSESAGVSKNWVHVAFQDYAIGSGFTAGEPAATASSTLLIRSGRSAEYEHGLSTRLWKLLEGATRAPDDQIVAGIQEMPSSQAMEMGQIMPEVESG
jgi:phenylpyruvate tautomerase PptA (4-oxalocrotonate tautomerase family)